MYDILIKNGTILDGTGKRDGFISDIGISNGIIVNIGHLSSASAKKVIDADGLFVSPGFIDVLSHSDTYLTLFTIPKQNSLISQGITTIIGGNCGSSLAPLVNSRAIESVQKWTDSSQINVDWLRMSEFLNVLKEKNKLSLNFGTLTGYSTIRNGILKGEQRQLSEQESDMAKLLLEQSQKEGSFGMSSGLTYSGEKMVLDTEMDKMLDVVSKQRGIFTVHLRNEAEKVLESLEEVLAFAKKAKVKIHISHLKIIGQNNWSKFDELIERIEKAKNKGIDITFDVFPYASNGMILYSVLPAWAKMGNKSRIKERLNDPDDRKKIEKDLAGMNLNYKKITIASFAGDKLFLGKTISDIAESWEVSEESALVELLIASNLQIIVFAHILNEDNLQKAIKHPLCIVSSDGAGYDLAYQKSGALPHPRAFGAFARFLRKYPNKNNLNILDYKDAVYKITGFPAERFCIEKRGNIKPKFFADITIFDPEKIEELTTFEEPYKYSIGISNVIVNGKIAYDNEKYIDGYGGKVLKRK